MIVQPQGGAIRRPGSKYIKNTQGNVAARLIPFVYSKTEAYVVELTNNAIRVINVATKAVSTPSSVGATLYTAAQIDDIKFVQSADVLYLVHPDVSPQTLGRTATDAFTLSPYQWIYGPTSVLRFPYMRNGSAITLSCSDIVAGNTATLTASSPLFTANHADAIFKLNHATKTGAVQITSVVNSTTANVYILNALESVGVTQDWEEQAWSKERGWPRAVTFFGGRLVYGGTKYQPDTFWASKASNYSIFMQRKFLQDASADTSNLHYYGPLTASDACGFGLASQEVNQIQWLSSGKSLVAGTLGAEYVIPSLSATDVVTASAESTFGSAYVQPKRVSYSVIYVPRSGNELNEMTFNFQSNSYVSIDLMFYADHITSRTTLIPSLIKQLEYSSSRKVIWAVTNDGGLYSVTRVKDQEISAWTSHFLGGIGRVQSAASIPSPSGRGDELWLCVSRLINGTPQFFVEIIGNDFSHSVLKADIYSENMPPIFSDAAIYLTGLNQTHWTGLNHLATATVSILADGAPLPNQTVQPDGSIDLPVAASSVVIGLPYTSKLRTTRIEAGAALGSAQGAIKRIDRLDVRFHRTAGAKCGPSFDKLQNIPFKQPSDTEYPLFDGDKVISMDSGYERDGYVCIQQDQPLPMTILSITARGATNEQ